MQKQIDSGRQSPEMGHNVGDVLRRLKDDPVSTFNALIGHLRDRYDVSQIEAMVQKCLEAIAPPQAQMPVLAGMPHGMQMGGFESIGGSPPTSPGKSEPQDLTETFEDAEEQEDGMSDGGKSNLETDEPVQETGSYDNVWANLIATLKASGNTEQLKFLPTSLPDRVGRVVQTVMIWLSMIATWGLASKHAPKFLKRVGLGEVDAISAVAVLLLTVWVSMCSESITARLIDNIRNVKTEWKLNTAGKGRVVNVAALPIGFLMTLRDYFYTAPKEVIVGLFGSVAGRASDLVTKENRGIRSDSSARAMQGMALITALFLGGIVNYKGQIEQLERAWLDGPSAQKTLKERAGKLDVSNPGSSASALLNGVKRNAVDQMGEITARRYADEIGVPRGNIVYDPTDQWLYYQPPRGKRVRVEISDPPNKADQLGIPAVPNATGSGRRGKKWVATGLLTRFERAKGEVEHENGPGKIDESVARFRTALHQVLTEHRRDTDSTVELPGVGEVDFGRIYRFFQLSGSSKEEVFAEANRRFTKETDPRIKDEMRKLYAEITVLWQQSDQEIAALESQVAGGKRKDVPFESFIPPEPNTEAFKKLPEEMETFFTMDAKQVMQEYGPQGLMLLGMMVIAFVMLSECVAKAGVMPNWHYFWLYTVARNLKIFGLKVKRAALRMGNKDGKNEEALERIELRLDQIREEIQGYQPPEDLVNPVRNTALRLALGQKVAHERETEHLPGVIEGTEANRQAAVEDVGSFLEPVREAAEELGFALVPQHLDPEFMQHVAEQRLERMLAPQGEGRVMRVFHDAMMHTGGLVADVLTADTLRDEEHEVADKKARMMKKVKKGGYWKGEAWWRFRTKDAQRYFLEAFVPGGHKLPKSITTEQLAARLEFYLQCREWGKTVDLAMDKQTMKSIIDRSSSDQAAVLRKIGNVVYPRAFTGSEKQQDKDKTSILGYRAFQEVRSRRNDGAAKAPQSSIPESLAKGMKAKAMRPWQAMMAKAEELRGRMATSLEGTRSKVEKWAERQEEAADQAAYAKMAEALAIVMDATSGGEYDEAEVRKAYALLHGYETTNNANLQRLWRSFLEQIVDEEGEEEGFGLGSSAEEIRESIQTILNQAHDLLISARPSQDRSVSQPSKARSSSRTARLPETRADADDGLSWREMYELRERSDVIEAIESLADFARNGIAAQDIPEFDRASEKIVGVYDGNDFWLKTAVGLAWEEEMGAGEGQGWESLNRARNRLIKRVDALESQQAQEPVIYRGEQEEKRQEELAEKLKQVQGKPPAPKVLPATPKAEPRRSQPSPTVPTAEIDQLPAKRRKEAIRMILGYPGRIGNTQQAYEIFTRLWRTDEQFQADAINEAWQHYGKNLGIAKKAGLAKAGLKWIMEGEADRGHDATDEEIAEAIEQMLFRVRQDLASQG